MYQLKYVKASFVGVRAVSGFLLGRVYGSRSLHIHNRQEFYSVFLVMPCIIAQLKMFIIVTISPEWAEDDCCSIFDTGHWLQPTKPVPGHLEDS